MITTVSPTYIKAKATIEQMVSVLGVSRNPATLEKEAVWFEDTMNGLSGDILNLEPDLQKQIQAGCGAIVGIAAKSNVTIHLYESLLPVELTTVETSETQTAKRLYPRTETVTVIKTSETIVPPSSNNQTTTDTIPVIVGPDGEIVTEDEVIDPIFDEIDSEPVEDDFLSEIQDETAPYLKDGMIALAMEAAANANGLQAGLTVFSHNPLADVIEDTKELLLYYTRDNYANLNVELAAVSTDPTLNVEYKALREAIGGPDGLSGCVAQMDFFKEHTDRLSGLVLDVDSPNDVTDNDSTDEFLNINDVSGGPIVIFSFDARYFRSAKYMVQATAAALDRGHQATELYILHDNHHAYTRELTSIYTQDPFCTYTTRLLNNKVEVLANTSASNTDFVIHGVRLRIARAAQSYGEMSQNKILEQHELLASYLDDGVDYVAFQSASLLKGNLVANLARDFRDILVNLNGNTFLTASTPVKQSTLISMAETIKTRRSEIQTAIESDYEAFLECRRKTEALDIAYNLSAAYSDEGSRTIPALTLNNAAIQAIEETNDQ